jgi:hypothetical protein
LAWQALRFDDNHFKKDGYGPKESSLSNWTALSSESPTTVHRLEENVTGVISRPRRSGRIEVIAPEETSKKIRCH